MNGRYNPSMLQGLSFEQEQEQPKDDLSMMFGQDRRPASSADYTGQEIPQAAGAGAMAGGPAGAAIGAGAGLVGMLAQQAQQRQMAKIQNELLRRKNMQQTIQQGAMGIQEAQQQNLNNLARAFLR